MGEWDVWKGTVGTKEKLRPQGAAGRSLKACTPQLGGGPPRTSEWAEWSGVQNLVTSEGYT